MSTVKLKIFKLFFKKQGNSGHILFSFFSPPEHALLLPAHFTHSTKAFTHSLNNFFYEFWQVYLWADLLEREGERELFYLTCQSYYMFSSWTNCLLFTQPFPNPSLPTSNPQGMIVDKSYFLNKYAENNNDNAQEFNAKTLRPHWRKSWYFPRGLNYVTMF